MNLVIVESPTKAKTISKFLPKEYTVTSSYGHIRDLPKSTLGVDVENDFDPQYRIPNDKRKITTDLKKLAKKADKIYFATDEDREGEAIAWHLSHILEKDANNAEKKRITFHEITKPAILQALKDPRDLDLNRVDAQQARRVLDRLVGYELSPFLWKKIARGLSAGRVQSVALRMIVEREREIQKFKPQEYWSLAAFLFKDSAKDIFEALLRSKASKAYKKLDIKSKAEMDEILADLEGATYKVAKVEKKERKRNPLPPFTTSTLQITAHNRFGYSSRQIMLIAQQLYEGIDLGKLGQTGLITYMRTDSVNLSEQFLENARNYIGREVGSPYLPGKPQYYKTKSKNAQEAHEAIRPTDVSKNPNSVRQYLDATQLKVYELIWQRAIASQMNPAIYDATSMDIVAEETSYVFRVSGATLKFDGFQKIYPVNREDKILPDLNRGDVLKLKELKPAQHFTEPPPRYSDGSLVKELEEKGIGRPSTYAPIISTIQTRNYVERNDAKQFEPTEIGFLVNDVLVQHFKDIVDYTFTARMEEELDEIAAGKMGWKKSIRVFYEPFKENLEKKNESVKREDIMKQCEVGIDPETGLTVIARYGRFGPFVQLGEWSDEDKKAKKNKPKSASLKKDQSIETITLEEALKLLILPRVVGQNGDGEDIVVNTGRFGPYLKAGKVTVSLPETMDAYEITLKECQELIKNADKIKKKQAEPIAELGKDPNSKGAILVKNGRFGPYITDGKTNVSVPKAVDARDVTFEMAIEMLEKKRKAPKRNSTRKRTRKK